MKHLLIPLMFLAAPAMAQDICDDLWFTRNLHFDRAGYCFGSTLGKALFDNSNCTGNDVTLDPQIKQQIAEIRETEGFLGCKVDTYRHTLTLPDLAIRRRLSDLPIHDEFASGCLGWLGETAPLRNGRDEAAEVIGQVEMGDYVLFSFRSRGGWSYVTTHLHDFSGLKSGGWIPDAIFPQEACANWAG